MKNDLLLLNSPAYEKATSAIRTMVARHHGLYHLGVVLTVLVTGIFYIAMGFYGNRRRLAAIFMLSVFFVLGSSFAYPAAVHANDPDVLGAGRQKDFLSGVEKEVPAPAKEVALYEIAHETADNGAFGESGEADVPFALPATSDITFDANDWRLILVNKTHPIPEDYEFPIGDLNNEQQCDARIIPQINEMFAAAARDGVYLILASPYRTDHRQETLFTNRVNTLMDEGLSYSEAYSEASLSIMIPGSSEHQIGLAVDITTGTYERLDAGFAETKAGQWLKDNCKEYGFILRYLDGREQITGVEFEPWHFRYVGVDAARIIMENDITLEEFWSTYIYR